MLFGTKAIHAGVEPDPSTGAIMTPIFQTSTYVQESPAQHKGYAYARGANPTRNQLQKSIAALENGKFGLCFSSGMAATDAVLRLLNPGDEVITSNDLYGGSYRLFTKVYERVGIKFHFIDLTDASNAEKYINSKTKLFWVETPSNPLMRIIDVEACVKMAKKHNCRVAVDNTFASPYLQNPLSLGADIVMHSVTKYLGGHSDVIMGALIVNDEKLHQDLAFIANSCGAVPGPQDSFLVLRGIKTLHLRMERHCSNALELACWLEKQPGVRLVRHPFLRSHPQYELAKRQMRGGSGLIVIELDCSAEAALVFCRRLRLFTLAESLGGVESLVCHPATMTHASVPAEVRRKVGIGDGLLRLSVGVEDVEDLRSDLEEALQAVLQRSES